MSIQNLGKKFLLMLTFVGVSSITFANATVASPDLAVSKTTANQVLKKVSLTEKAILAALILPIFRFYMKEPCNEPARITWSEAKNFFGSPTKLTAALKDNPKDVLAKLWYVFDDLIIGRAYESSSLKADKESGKIIVKEGGKPQGIIGTLHAYKKSIANTACALIAAKLFMDWNKEGFDKIEQKDLYTVLALLGITSICNGQ
jgi:hypothetical protein